MATCPLWLEHDKGMSQRRRTAADLEPTVTLPKGGIAPRCQALKKDGKQCGGTATAGFDVCWKHGSGSPKRVAEGVRKSVRTGRPLVHGLYSKRMSTHLREVIAALDEAQVELDDADAEIKVAKAVLAFTIDRSDDIADAVEGLPHMIEEFREALADAVMDPADWREARKFLTQAVAATVMLDSWTSKVAGLALEIVKATKARAETKAKLAQAEALDTIRTYALAVRHIVWDLLPEEQFDVYEDRLRREVFAPNGLVLEAPDEDDAVEVEVRDVR